MSRLDELLLLTPKISPTEAELFVLGAVSGSQRGIRLEGSVSGPFCAFAHTLPLSIPIKSPSLRNDQTVKAVVRIPEPCLWEPQHPYYYKVHLQLRHSDTLLDSVEINTGIRHLAIHQDGIVLNGNPYEIVGVRHSADATRDGARWVQTGCNAWLTVADKASCNVTDVHGPMILHFLPGDAAEILDQVRELRNRPSILMWVLSDRDRGGTDADIARQIRQLDPSRAVAQVYQEGTELHWATLRVNGENVSEKANVSIAIAGDPIEPCSTPIAEFAQSIAAFRDVAKRDRTIIAGWVI